MGSVGLRLAARKRHTLVASLGGAIAASVDLGAAGSNFPSY
jgi:hypothetical protein